ncbi:MAG: FtsK/SpoIIIE domain-containing protein [Acidimicrobiales bacterium]
MANPSPSRSNSSRSNSAQSNPSFADEIMELLIRFVTVWRVELVLVGVPTALGIWLYVHLGPVLAGVITATVVLAVVLTPPSRRLLARILHRESVRRHLDVAFGSRTGILSDRQPIVGTVVRTNGGDRVQLGLRRGTSIEELARAQAIIASSLGVRDVRMAADPSHQNLVTLSIIRRDPFASNGLRCPMVNAKGFDASEPIPVGVDEEGEIVHLLLVEHNVLFGGEPGGGKSVTLSVLVAAFALDPSVTLWLFDGKLVELAPWSGCAERFVGPDVTLAISVLQELRAEMDRRYGELVARKVKKVTPGDGLSLNVVVIDELALYVAGIDKKLADRFTELLRDLVARGRAAGIIVIAATQKPSIDIVPSALRDLFGFRWALRCATREASDTVLGSGWASRGFSAADIAPSMRGVGLLLHEGGIPLRLRSFHLSDADVRVIAERASRLRHHDADPMATR